ncbi:MAG TPA: hypothetical protein VGI22_27715 [Xanthobacteraceae bacterium]
MSIADRLSSISFWTLSAISLLASFPALIMTLLMAMASGPTTEPGNETATLVLLTLCLALSAWLFIGPFAPSCFMRANVKRPLG